MQNTSLEQVTVKRSAKGMTNKVQNSFWFSQHVMESSTTAPLHINTFAVSYLNTQGLNNSCLKSPASTLVDLTFQSRALRSFSLNQLRNLSL